MTLLIDLLLTVVGQRPSARTLTSVSELIDSLAPYLNQLLVLRQASFALLMVLARVMTFRNVGSVVWVLRRAM